MRLIALAVLFLSGSAVAQSSSTASSPSSAAVARGKSPGAAFAWYEGRWRLPQEIAYLQRAAALRGAAVVPAPKAQPARAPKPVTKVARVPVQKHARLFGLLTVRAQQTRLLGFDTVTVGFGTG